jgi:hypothetical protein
MAGADDERTWVDWMREASAWDILLPCPDMFGVARWFWLVGDLCGGCGGWNVEADDFFAGLLRRRQI